MKDFELSNSPATSRLIGLDGMWQVRQGPLNAGPEDLENQITAKDNWIDTPVPGDIHQGLINAGRISEPLTGLGSYESEWVSEYSWWLRKSFEVAADMLNAGAAELELDGLDANASIFINGICIGGHPSAFRPLRRNILKYLVPGINTVIVRLTNGLEKFTEEHIKDLGGWVITEAVNGRPDRGDARRVFVRKPQYSWGWDWSPKIATVGITGHCRIRFLHKACIRDISVKPLKQSQDVPLSINTTVEWLDRYKIGRGKIRLTISDKDKHTAAILEKEMLLQSGLNYFDLEAVIKNAHLWWPSQMGEPYLYTIKAELIVDGTLADEKSFEYGIRFLELQTEDTFAILINGKKVFCKGASWVPADAIYGRVRDEKIEHLIAEARKANFNMLRIWGGGLYERESFYQACDREGIMVWQDFMFACAPYPDHVEEFCDEISKEADYQTRRLSKHACVVMYSGGNENLLGFLPEEGTGEITDRGSTLFGVILPEAVRRNGGGVPYWYNSPYGGDDSQFCKDTTYIGDTHLWRSAMMDPNMETRITPEVYDQAKAKFVSEFGFPGPCSIETTLECVGTKHPDRESKAWRHHCNPWEKDNLELAIAKNYGISTQLSLEEYLLYGGMAQGRMLGHSLESLRASSACNGALFWMYNDAWGEVGWSIIDYYLRRKISWYFVRRALAPRRLVMRRKQNEISVTLLNDVQYPLNGILEYGYMSCDGSNIIAEKKEFAVDGLSRTLLAVFGQLERDPRRGIWFARIVENDEILPGIYKAVDYHRLELQVPRFELNIQPVRKGEYLLNITSTAFAHATQLDVPDETCMEDNYFDLLPGHPHKVRVSSSQNLNIDNIGITSFSPKMPLILDKDASFGKTARRNSVLIN